MSGFLSFAFARAAKNNRVNIGFRPTVLARAPTFFWGFDDAIGTTVADATGNGRTGVYVVGSGHAYRQSSIVTSEQYSVKSSDRMYSNAAFMGLSGSWSIAGWFQPSSTGAMSLCGIGDSNNYNTSAKHSTTTYIDAGGKLNCSVYVSSLASLKTATGSTNVGTGRHHFAVEIDGSAQNINVYVDGVLDGQTALGGAAEAFTGYLHAGYTSQSSDAPIFVGGALQDFYGFLTLQGASAWLADFNAGK